MWIYTRYDTFLSIIQDKRARLEKIISIFSSGEWGMKIGWIASTLATVIKDVWIPGIQVGFEKVDLENLEKYPTKWCVNTQLWVNNANRAVIKLKKRDIRAVKITPNKVPYTREISHILWSLPRVDSKSAGITSRIGF